MPHHATAASSARGPLRLARAALAALLVGLAGCTALSGPDGLPDDLSWQTVLALSPDGRQLVVVRPLRNDRGEGWLVSLDQGVLRASRRLDLPDHTTHFAFDRDGVHLLVTTWSDNTSRLLRFDPSDGRTEVLQQGDHLWRSPKQGSDGALYVAQFIQTQRRMAGEWQRFTDGRPTPVSRSRNPVMGALQEVQGALFGIEATPDPKLTVMRGTLPPELRQVFPPGSWSLACADTTPATCVRSTLHRPVTSYYSTIDVLRGTQRCTVDGQWVNGTAEHVAAGGVVAFVGTVKGAWRDATAVYVAVCPATGGTIQPVPLSSAARTAAAKPR